MELRCTGFHALPAPITNFPNRFHADNLIQDGGLQDPYYAKPLFRHSGPYLY
jgi:hypothetical protein